MRLFAVSTLKLAYVLRQAQKEAFSVCKVFFTYALHVAVSFAPYPKTHSFLLFVKQEKRRGYADTHMCALMCVRQVRRRM